MHPPLSYTITNGPLAITHVSKRPLMPRYSWNTAKFGVSTNQSINQPKGHFKNKTFSLIVIGTLNLESDDGNYT